MSSRKFFILFIACAAVPLIAAQLSLSMGWFSQGGNNKGQWLQHEIQLLPDLTHSSQDKSLQDTFADASVHWHLVYVQAAACDQECEQALFTLQQLYAGMGRKQLKIKPVVMAAQEPAQLKQFPALGWQPEQSAATELQNQIVIVNQRGLVLLRYPVDSNPEHMRDLARDIRTDLLRLINYDRSGA
ncbi:hypothetical protein [Cellvibrio fibrivorans]|uniref:Thioredoxin domain-containing protein n=1 Tax=Cellvibrio fibrivorans TaxID=126350 RepID=A0ABU1US53_9GAMM|nr:hypothetical protein [Cellvibrio fibrivorans]MDR7088014.1 hypothetical protein [Cellvibrio fibrivorans]